MGCAIQIVEGLGGLVGWICMLGCRVPCAKLVLMSDRLEFAFRHDVSVVEGVRRPFFCSEKHVISDEK